MVQGGEAVVVEDLVTKGDVMPDPENRSLASVGRYKDMANDNEVVRLRCSNRDAIIRICGYHCLASTLASYARALTV